VSPSVSSAAAPQMPSTSQLDPSASEFVPSGDRSAATSSDSTMEDEPSESFRPDSVQASTSSPAPPTQSAQTSTSGGTTQTTASVQPTLKRAREVEVSHDESAVAGPSGMQKKAKTVTSTEEAEQSYETGDSDVNADSQEGGDSEIYTSDVTRSDDNNVVSSGATGREEEEEGQAEEGMEYAADDVEEGEVTEDEEEEIAGPEEEDDGLEDGEDDEDAEAQVADTLDEDHDLLEDEGDDGENSNNVPSSSTGASMSGTTQQLGRSTFTSAASAVQGVSAFEVETGEDSVVPGTPKLLESRRQDEFSEAVSSPQVPSFEFGSASGAGSSSSTLPEPVETSDSGLSGQAGTADRTSYDISQLAADTHSNPVVISPQPPQAESIEMPAGQSAEEGESEAESAQEAVGEGSSGAASIVVASAAILSEESGVSSSGTTDASSRARLQRKPIIWGASPPSSAASSRQSLGPASSRQSSGPASTSPQRSLTRVPVQLTKTLQGAARGRGVAKRGGARGAGKRGGAGGAPK